MKLGIIGYGNMAKAILGGILEKRILDPKDIIVSSKTEESIIKAKEDYDVKVTLDNSLVAESDIVLLAVEPNKYSLVLKQIKDSLRDSSIIWTIAAGISLSEIDMILNEKHKVIRTMPNTPAKIGYGVTAVTPNSLVTKEELEYVNTLISSFSLVKIISEDLMESIVPVTGSSPAMIFMFIEAMAEEAISLGFSSKDSYDLACASIIGSAKMVLETKEHPASLRDKVCTPGGVTINMVKTLEKEGFKRSIIKAMDSCMNKK